MKISIQSIEKALAKVNRVGLRSYKSVHHLSGISRSSREQMMLFIFGCQRSGTTLLVNVFERDLRTKVYREFSELSSMDDKKGLRYDPLPVLKMKFDRQAAPYIVLKPLVESQNAPELLDYFPAAKALWVYRDYRDVAASNINKFGVANGLDDLKPIVDGDPDNWRSERVTTEVRNRIKEYYTQDMAPHNAAALFWFARNRLYFDLGLEKDSRVMIVKYEELVCKPEEMMQQVYGFSQQPFPGPRIVRDVHATSLGKGRDIQLDPDVSQICSRLQKRLDDAYDVLDQSNQMVSIST